VLNVVPSGPKSKYCPLMVDRLGSALGGSAAVAVMVVSAASEFAGMFRLAPVEPTATSPPSAAVTSWETMTGLLPPLLPPQPEIMEVRAAKLDQMET
jgi:hypothetical protein